MRTTIKLDDALLIEAKGISARTGATLASVIEDAIRESFARRRRAAEARDPGPPLPPAFGRGGLIPGVDLDDSADLLDRMDGRGS